MTERRPKYRIENAPNGRARVVENSTDLILRTLDDRVAAIKWLEQLDPPVPAKVKNK